jgi:hypothetical protein
MLQICRRFSKLYCGLRPIKCRQVPKTNISNCRVWKKLPFEACRQSQSGFTWPEAIVFNRSSDSKLLSMSQIGLPNITCLLRCLPIKCR